MVEVGCLQEEVWRAMCKFVCVLRCVCVCVCV